MAAAVILLLLSAVLMILSANVPAFAEWYSESIYPLAVNNIGRICGLVPFSVSEIGIYILLRDQLSQEILFRRGGDHYLQIHGTGPEGGLSVAD